MTTDTPAEEAAPAVTAIVLAEPKRVEQRLLAEQNLAKLEPLLAEQRITPERFVRVVVQALAKSPDKLQACTEQSIVLAVMESAQLGLEPTGVLGMAYLVPFWNSKLRPRGAYEAKLIVGYRGYIDLMRRSGEVRTVESRVVYDGDYFDAGFGLPQRLEHVPWYVLGKSPEAAGDRRFVYWLARLANGEAQMDILTMAEVEQARKVSKAADDGPWVTWPDEMAKKTAIRRSVKVLPVAIYAARRAAELEDEAEREADVRISGPRRLTARDRALALIAGEGVGDEEAAGQDAAASEAAPDGEATDDTAATAEGQEGAPDAPEGLTGEPDSEEGLPEIPDK